MPVEGQTGLVVPVPAADALLGLVESRHSGTVREGVPAHVSLLYPFVGVAELDERVIQALRELVAGHEPMPVQFAECYRREGFVALRPDPIEALTELTRKACERWPDLVPYEGLYGKVEPHVTVALRASEETAVMIEREVTEQLPISAELREVVLVAFEGRWRLRGRFEFGAGQ
jgi:2'-5' RNA ligase superfamily